MLVQNVSGSGGHKPPKYKTWIQYYKSHYKIKSIVTCAEYNCYRQEHMHGAHINIYFCNLVKIPHKTYIVPLCPTHNNPRRVDTFYIKGNTQLLECDYINYKLYIGVIIVLYIILNCLIRYIRNWFKQ